MSTGPLSANLAKRSAHSCVEPFGSEVPLAFGNCLQNEGSGLLLLCQLCGQKDTQSRYFVQVENADRAFLTRSVSM